MSAQRSGIDAAGDTVVYALAADAASLPNQDG